MTTSPQCIAKVWSVDDSTKLFTSICHVEQHPIAEAKKNEQVAQGCQSRRPIPTILSGAPLPREGCFFGRENPLSGSLRGWKYKMTMPFVCLGSILRNLHVLARDLMTVHVGGFSAVRSQGTSHIQRKDLATVIQLCIASLKGFLIIDFRQDKLEPPTSFYAKLSPPSTQPFSVKVS